MNYTPEQLYQIWHHEIFAVKGQAVRSVKDFTKVYEKPEWPEFVRFAGMVARNSETLSPHLYVRALATFWNGWFPPNELNNRKSMAIYRDYIANLQANNDPLVVFNSVVASIRFIAQWCAERKIKTFKDYLYRHAELIPPIALHIDSGDVSVNFLAMIDRAPDFIKAAYPPDVVADYFSKFINEYDMLRTRVVRIPDLQQCAKMTELESLISAQIAAESQKIATETVKPD